MQECDVDAQGRCPFTHRFGRVNLAVLLHSAVSSDPCQASSGTKDGSRIPCFCSFQKFNSLARQKSRGGGVRLPSLFRAAVDCRAVTLSR